MRASLTPDLFRHNQLEPDRCVDVAVALGPLARWWLTEGALAEAAAELGWSGEWFTHRPVLPSDPGGCWVILVNRDESTKSLLRSAVVLPLVWRADAPHAAELPPDIRRLADAVLDVLKKERGVGDRLWGLHIAAMGGAPPDLSKYEFRNEDPAASDNPAASGFAPVAAGLLMAVDGLCPAPNVWVTGIWDVNRGFLEVGGLEEKIRCAAQRGDVTDFFVPFSQQQKVAQKSPEMTIRVLARGTNARVALNGLLAAWGREPDDDADLDALVRFHRDQASRDRTSSDDFYRRKLLPRIAFEQRGGEHSADGDSASMPTHGVAIASQNWETIPQFVAAFRIHEIRILHDTLPSSAENARRAADWCRTLPGVSEALPVEFDYPSASKGARFRSTLAAEFNEKLADFLRAVPVDRIAWFLLPGLTMMKFALAEATARRGSLMVCLENDYDQQLKIPRPGSERYITWRAGDPWLPSNEDG